MVLAAGGQGNGGALASAEVYNPTTATWTTTASLATPRYFFQMVLLPNGSVLAAGGQNFIDSNMPYLASAEVYNPTTNTWTATASLATARANFQMVLLPNGNVLAVGGFSFGSGDLASAELYNPTTGTWTTTGSLATRRREFSMVLLPNGNVLAAGGFGGSYNTFLASAEVYNPITATWTATASLATARIDLSMVLLPNGIVIAAGGENELNGSGVALASAELYNPTTSTWATAASLATSRYSFQMLPLPSGNALAAGGVNNVNGRLASAELYNPTINMWTTIASLAFARYDFQMLTLPNGNILAAGGNGDMGFVAQAELYSPTTAMWTTSGSFATARSRFQMASF